MRNKKKLISALLAIVMALVIFTPTSLHANEINVTIDGVAVNFEGQGPALVDGRTLVPVRGVFEELGFEIGWDQDTQTAILWQYGYIDHDGEDVRVVVTEITITIGEDNFNNNDRQIALDVPAQIIGGRTMLPIRAVVESVGYYVDWNGATSTVVISSTPIGGGQATVYCTSSTDIISDLTNPANYWIELDGVRLSPGMTVSQFLASGAVQIRDESDLDTMLGTFGTAIFTFHVHDGSIWRGVMTTTIRNTNQDAVPLSDGIVASFAMDNFQANMFDDVVFINGIRLGETTRAEIIAMFGEPDVAGEISIQYRPFFDNRERNRSLMFAGYTFNFDRDTDVLTRVNMDFADFEQ